MYRAFVLASLHTAAFVIANTTRGLHLLEPVVFDGAPNIRIVAHTRRILGAQMHQVGPDRPDPEVLLHRIRDELFLEVYAGR